MSENVERPCWRTSLFCAAATVALAVVAVAVAFLLGTGTLRVGLYALAGSLVLSTLGAFVVTRDARLHEDEWLREELGNDEPRGWWGRSFGVNFRRFLPAWTLPACYPLAVLLPHDMGIGFAVGWVLGHATTIPFAVHWGRRYQRISDGEEPLPEAPERTRRP